MDFTFFLDSGVAKNRTMRHKNTFEVFFGGKSRSRSCSYFHKTISVICRLLQSLTKRLPLRCYLRLRDALTMTDCVFVNNDRICNPLLFYCQLALPIVSQKVPRSMTPSYPHFDRTCEAPCEPESTLEKSLTDWSACQWLWRGMSQGGKITTT